MNQERLCVRVSPRPGPDVVPVTFFHTSLTTTQSQGRVQLSVRLETVGYLRPQDKKENTDVSEHYHSVLGSDLVGSHAAFQISS